MKISLQRNLTSSNCYLSTEEKNKKQNLSQESKIRPNFIQSKCKISIH